MSDGTWEPGKVGAPPLEWRATPQQAQWMIDASVWVRELDKAGLLERGWQSRVAEHAGISNSTVHNFFYGKKLVTVSSVRAIVEFVEMMTGAKYDPTTKAHTDLRTLSSLINVQQAEVSTWEKRCDEAAAQLDKALKRVQNWKGVLAGAEQKVEAAKQELRNLQNKWDYAYMEEQDRRADEDSELVGHRVDVEPLDEETAHGTVELSITRRRSAPSTCH